MLANRKPKRHLKGYESLGPIDLKFLTGQGCESTTDRLRGLLSASLAWDILQTLVLGAPNDGTEAQEEAKITR